MPSAMLAVPDRPAVPVPMVLRLDGYLRRSLCLDLPALRALTQHTVARAAPGCAARGLAPPATGLRRWHGVRLTTLLELAGLRPGPQRLRGAVCVHAHGRDGYVASFSWSELFNGPGGDDVLVALAADDTPLPPADLPRLIAAHDWQSSARQVRGLCRIEVAGPAAAHATATTTGQH